jgi:hypothetical protein
VILGFVVPQILQIGSSQSVLSFLSRQGGEFHGAAPCASLAVLLGLPSSLLLLQFVLKDVAIHLAHPYVQKLPKALSVSLDRLFMYLVAYRRCVGGSSPLHHVFPGGPSKWHQPLPAGVWLHTLLSLPPFFVGSFRVQSALFQCQALERRLKLLPSRGCVAHSAGKRMFAPCAKRYLLQLDAS